MTGAAERSSHWPGRSTPRCACPGSKSITNRALVCAALADGTSTLDGCAVGRRHRGDGRLPRARLGVGIDVDAGDDADRSTAAAASCPRSRAALDVRQSGHDGALRHAVARARPRARTRSTAATRMRGGRWAAGRRAARRSAPRSTRRSTGQLPSASRQGRRRRRGRRCRATCRASSSPGCCWRRRPARRAATSSSRPPLGVAPVRRPDRRGDARVRRRRRPADDAFAVAPGRLPRPRRTPSSPTRRRRRTSSPPPRSCGGRVRVDGLGAASAAGRPGVRRRARADGRGGGTRTDDDRRSRDRARCTASTSTWRDLSDTAQTLAVVAAFADGPTRVTGVGFIRGKESDRIGAVVTELQRLRRRGAARSPTASIVSPGPLAPAVVQTYDDHRMAMSFALLGLRVPGIEIADPGLRGQDLPRLLRRARAAARLPAG